MHNIGKVLERVSALRETAYHGMMGWGHYESPVVDAALDFAAQTCGQLETHLNRVAHETTAEGTSRAILQTYTAVVQLRVALELLGKHRKVGNAASYVDECLPRARAAEVMLGDIMASGAMSTISLQVGVKP